jgi:hypothetical protein
VRPFPGVVEGNQVQWPCATAEQTKRSPSLNGAWVLDWPYFSTVGRSYDVSPDGERFPAIRAGDAAANANAIGDITVVLNWCTELRERMGN